MALYVVNAEDEDGTGASLYEADSPEDALALAKLDDELNWHPIFDLFGRRKAEDGDPVMEMTEEHAREVGYEAALVRFDGEAPKYRWIGENPPPKAFLADSV